MILVVDDDKTIRLSLKLILERNGYEVTLAEGPKEAIQIVRNTPAVELVLMDMNYSSSTCYRLDRGYWLSSDTSVPRQYPRTEESGGKSLADEESGGWSAWSGRLCC